MMEVNQKINMKMAQLKINKKILIKTIINKSTDHQDLYLILKIINNKFYLLSSTKVKFQITESKKLKVHLIKQIKIMSRFQIKIWQIIVLTD